MKLDTLDKLFVHELKDIHSAEKQILKALPKMREAATHQELKDAFQSHETETEEQVRRLEKIFESLDYQPGGHKCVAMAGLIEEGEELIKADAEPAVRDAGLIGAAQRVEHYEIAAYGTAVALAEKLGNQEAVRLLRETLQEEGDTDKKLTTIAETVVNQDALAGS